MHQSNAQPGKYSLTKQDICLYYPYYKLILRVQMIDLKAMTFKLFTHDCQTSPDLC